VTSRLATAAELAHRGFARILLIKPSSLGDIVHALPVLHGLRTRYPTAKIDWLVGKAFAQILDGHPEIDELIPFDRARFSRVGRNPIVAVEFARFLWRLRRRRYDLVIDLQGLFRTGFLAWATRSKVRLGFADAREGAARFYTHALPPVPEDTHAVDQNFRVGSVLGFERTPIEFRLGIAKEVRSEALKLLGGYWHVGDERLVAVVPGARWETKLWPAERFAETIDYLQTKAPVKCVLLGAPDEVALCEEIARQTQTAPLILAGRTDLRQFATILGLADVVLCQDSSAAHLAVALGRPLVCLTGPTNPRRTGPYRREDDVVRLPLDCSPCYFRKLDQCPHDHKCMRDLDTTLVIGAVRRALGEAADGVVEKLSGLPHRPAKISRS